MVFSSVFLYHVFWEEIHYARLSNRICFVPLHRFFWEGVHNFLSFRHDLFCRPVSFTPWRNTLFLSLRHSLSCPSVSFILGRSTHPYALTDNLEFVRANPLFLPHPRPLGTDPLFCNPSLYVFRRNPLLFPPILVH